MMVWLKFLHIATIAIWSAGLVSLPGLYVQRAHARDDDTLYRLQGMVRFAYVALISPAAFIAIGTGTALILVQETFEPWFHLKLLLVALLVVVHVLTGLVIIRLFREGETYSSWRAVVVTILTVIVATAIIGVVLLKPDLGDQLLPDILSEPGALGDMFQPFIDRYL
jgi:protoporphyrinogen IX oxidase